MTADPTNIVIFSHGFGVRKTNRGLFTAIADALPHTQSIMFDYNPIHEKSNTTTVKPLNEQAQKLRKVINTARAEYPDATIDLVCHSQGCVVAALLKPRGIRKIIMLAPPSDMSAATVAERLGRAREEPIDLTARTRLLRSDGSTTVIRPEYWRSLYGVKPIKLYSRMARFTKLRIMNAKQDEVLGDVSFDGIDPSVSIVTLDGNHNFEDEKARNQIIYIIRKELAID